ncbi:helix-turn-helix domain-containing protein [Leifsonia sp. NPDC056824]|uniref:helix-turn-helix domain-containing protein n=1 Tax=Leifsonia sp. NPDC056824 TaxID=3345953 RepID=UPI0036A36B0A
MVPSELPAWITVREAAEHKRVDVKTIRRYISAGLIKAERVGPRLIRVETASLNNLGRPLQHTEGQAREGR